jgi:hypothetical protein
MIRTKTIAAIFVLITIAVSSLSFAQSKARFKIDSGYAEVN